MWSSTIRTVRTVALVLLAFAGLFFLVEVVRAGQTLYALHPAAGWAFGIGLAGLGLWLVGRLVWVLICRPPLLVPPILPEMPEASARELHRYGRYLQRYLDRLSDNPALNSDQRQTARAGRAQLETSMESAGDQEGLLAAINTAETEAVQPLVDHLDGLARRQVRTAMRDVMIGVTLSPWRAVDLWMVFYRNLGMITEVIRTYNHRPRLREQLAIYRDILALVAAVNFLSMGKNLLEGLCAKVPGVGRFLDDIAQGMGAGFLTAVAGHAALDRCKAIRRWDRRTAASALGLQAAAFYADVRDTFQKDILPAILRKVGDSSRETMDKIVSAINETGATVSSFVKVPLQAAVSAGGSVMNAGQNLHTFSKERWFSLFGRKKPPMP
jgi:hypothetical protein